MGICFLGGRIQLSHDSVFSVLLFILHLVSVENFSHLLSSVLCSSAPQASRCLCFFSCVFPVDKLACGKVDTLYAL